MNTKSKAYLVGGGIGSLAAAAFMIRDGNLPPGNISIFEAAPILGGSLDGAGDPLVGYSLRGGRMLTTDNYECTWDLYKSIPSLNNEGKTVFNEIAYPRPSVMSFALGPAATPCALVCVDLTSEDHKFSTLIICHP